MEEIEKNLNGDDNPHDVEPERRHSSMTDLSANTLATSQWQDNGSYHTSRPGSGGTLVSGYTGIIRVGHRIFEMKLIKKISGKELQQHQKINILA